MYKVTVKSGHHMHTDRRIYGPGEHFYVKFKSELPEAFQHRFEFLAIDPETVPKVRLNEDLQGQPLGGFSKGIIEEIPHSTVKLENLGRGWYNVIDPRTEKSANTKKLRLDDAKRLVAEINEQINEGISIDNAKEDDAKPKGLLTRAEDPDEED